MRDKGKNNKLKVVIAIGGGDDVGAFSEIVNTRAKLPAHFKEGEDFLVFGDGKSPIDPEEMLKQINGRIDNNTLIFIAGHGEKKRGEHYLSDIMGTGSQYIGDFISLFKNAAKGYPLLINLFSCHGEAALDITQDLPRKSIFIVHAENDSLSHPETADIELIKYHLEQGAKEGVENIGFHAINYVMQKCLQSCQPAIVEVSGSQERFKNKNEQSLDKFDEYKRYVTEDFKPKFLKFLDIFSDHSELSKGGPTSPLLDFAKQSFASLNDETLQKYFNVYHSTSPRDKWAIGIGHDIPALTLEYSKSPDKHHLHQNFLHDAAGYGAIKVLKQHFALNPNLPQSVLNQQSVNLSGRTPLTFAVTNNSLKGVRILLEKGADINAKDKDENTPLHAALDRFDYETAKFLIEKGADLTIGNKFGDGAIDIILRINSELAEFLETKKIDFSAALNKIIDERTPLDDAKENNDTYLEEFLLKHGAKSASEIENKRPSLLERVATSKENPLSRSH